MRAVGRPSRQAMFMAMAQAAAQRSTCDRRIVGCIITTMDGTSIVSLGYNGNARGLPDGCDSKEVGACGCIHAEANALIKAPYHQGPLHLYTTTAPCLACAKLILNSQVKVVYFKEDYRSYEGVKVLLQHGVLVYQMRDSINGDPNPYIWDQEEMSLAYATTVCP